MTIPAASEVTAGVVVHFDAFVDFCCPWCLIGLTQLERAVELVSPDLEIDVRIRPFLLDPHASPEGVEVARMLRDKHGLEPLQIFPTVEAAAVKCGIALDLARQSFSYPTQAAHLLVELAQQMKLGLPVARAIADAYFLHARNIADPQVLTDIAALFGISADDVLATFDDPQGRGRIEDAAKFARRAGVMSVPLAVLPGGQNLNVAGPLDMIVAGLRDAVALKG
jgi:predicted DsbA family dithiol-disulfide isomerase